MPPDDVTNSTRQRLVTWTDPGEIRETLLAMDGLAFFTAALEGALPLPPMLRLMGFRLRSVAEGNVVFEAEPAEYHYNPMAIVHGGFAATILDTAIGCSIQSRLPHGSGFTTLEIKVAYQRAMTDQTGTVHTETTIVSLGRRVASVESRLLDERGRAYATATSTCLILSADAGKA